MTAKTSADEIVERIQAELARHGIEGVQVVRRHGVGSSADDFATILKTILMAVGS